MSVARLTSVVLDLNGKYSSLLDEGRRDAYTTSSFPKASSPLQNAVHSPPSVSMAGISSVWPTGPFQTWMTRKYDGPIGAGTPETFDSALKDQLRKVLSLLSRHLDVITLSEKTRGCEQDERESHYHVPYFTPRQ